MKAGILLSLLIASCVTIEATKWGLDEENDVVVLDSSNFDNFIKRNRHVFVKFYAPWCSHCRAMAEDYSSLAIRMKEDLEGIPIAQINMDSETELGQRHKIEGYPTLRLFIDGEYVDYLGNHSHSAMFDWIKNKLNMAIEQLRTVAKVQEVEKNRIAVVLFTPPNMNYQLQNFKSAALKFDDIPFFYCDDTEVRKHYEVDGTFTIAVFRQFNDGRKFLTSKSVISEESMQSFIDSHRLPWVTPFTAELVHEIFNNERTSVFMFINGEASPDLYKSFEQLARKYQPDTVFSLVDSTSEMGGRLWKFLDIPEGTKSPARLIFFERGTFLKFRLDNADIDSLSQFIEHFKAAKLKPYFKSEIPSDHNESLIKTAVGTNFDEIVIENDKNVLVIGYSKYSKESMDLLRDLEYLAMELTKFDDVFIVKFNLESNEHSLMLPTNFPVIKLFKKNMKYSPAEVTMDKSFDAIVEFLEKHLDRQIIDRDEISAPNETGDIEVGTGEDLINTDL